MPAAAPTFLPPPLAFPPFAQPRRGMAYTCSAATNAGLVDNLVRRGLVRTPSVEAALRAVDRALFLPPATARPYADHPHPLPHAATVSAPHMHALALEQLAPALRPGAAALDVGAGSGLLMACLALLVAPGGSVIGVEHVPQLALLAQRNLDAWNQRLVDDDVLVTRAADGRLGAPDKAPFAAIHVGAAAPTIPPALLSQLAPGGVMVIPVGRRDHAQSLDVIRKDPDGNITRDSVCAVRYVPLCDLPQQLGHP